MSRQRTALGGRKRMFCRFAVGLEIWTEIGLVVTDVSFIAVVLEQIDNSNDTGIISHITLLSKKRFSFIFIFDYFAHK